MPKPFIITRRPQRFHFLTPKPDDFDAEEIAEALSRRCRWSGHCRSYYSVAQHSVYVSMAAAPHGHALWGLLHDAAEAFLPDVPRPLKALLKVATPRPGGRHKLEPLDDVENRILRAVAERFHLDPATPPECVRIADDRILATEYAQLFPPESAQLWRPDAEPFDWLKITPMPPTAAAAQWLNRFHRLAQEEPTP